MTKDGKSFLLWFLGGSVALIVGLPPLFHYTFYYFAYWLK